MNWVGIVITEIKLASNKFNWKTTFLSVQVVKWFTVVMSLGQIFLTGVGSAIFGLGLDLENFP